VVTDIGMTTVTISWTIPDYDPDDVCGSVMYRVMISGPNINETKTPNVTLGEKFHVSL